MKIDPVSLFNPKPFTNVRQDQGTVTPKAACAPVRAQEQGTAALLQHNFRAVKAFKNALNQGRMCHAILRNNFGIFFLLLLF